ncbi:MAG: hypothetical protein EZS28_024862 [Streblomastix strix]|uniref:Uncharacterized protein n=1 Tax=Streblomastix strix TaxID=222440 RepID=A0A5J4VAY7_9EUKA|nr:MAG: hypothetical protein EZS28_024862 [Streblomastix strix]
MVIFNREIESGIWEFTGKVTKMKYQFGIGIVDARQNLIPHPYDYENKNENNDEVRIVVDLKSELHTLFLIINNKIQPFCVMNIPDKVKFMFFFSTKDDEWEFVSLRELDRQLDINQIDARRRFEY